MENLHVGGHIQKDKKYQTVRVSAVNAVQGKCLPILSGRSRSVRKQHLMKDNQRLSSIR